MIYCTCKDHYLHVIVDYMDKIVDWAIHCWYM